MSPRTSTSKITWYEVAAFAAIIAVSWVNEFCGTAGLLFQRVSRAPDWRDPLVGTIVALLVGIPTILLSRRLSRRLRHLESFMKVCAWCHRVGHDDEWIGLEEYLKRTFNTETTHGICPSCSRKLRDSHDAGRLFPG